jgi:hypothetical protein
MDIKADVRQGRLALLVKTLESLGPLQGYGSTHFGALVRIVICVSRHLRRQASTGGEAAC